MNVLKKKIEEPYSDQNAATTEQEQEDAVFLEDDILENVSGGLVQLVNPSSSRL